MRQIIIAMAAALICSTSAAPTQAATAAQTPAIAKPQMTDLDYPIAYQRAVEAVMWSIPAISIREFREAAFQDYGITWKRRRPVEQAGDP